MYNILEIILIKETDNEKCSVCRQPHDRSATKCRTCVDKENARQKQQYQRRLAEGLCPRCGDKPTKSSKHCAPCKIRVRDKDRQIRSKRLENGLCSHCGINPPVVSLKTCGVCLLKLKNLHNDRIDRLNALGLCVRCGQLPRLSGLNSRGNNHDMCQTCYFKHISRYGLDSAKYADVLCRIFKDQEHKCPYTGEDLVLGGNAWLDHIMPRSRFPELANDPDNIEWVTERVNRMKQDRTHDEFLVLVKQIHDYCNL